MEFVAKTEFLQKILDEKVVELSMRIASIRALLEGGLYTEIEDVELISALTSFMDGKFDCSFDHRNSIKKISQKATKIILSDRYANPYYYTYFRGLVQLATGFRLAKEIIEILTAREVQIAR